MLFSKRTTPNHNSKRIGRGGRRDTLTFGSVNGEEALRACRSMTRLLECGGIERLIAACTRWTVLIYFGGRVGWKAYVSHSH